MVKKKFFKFAKPFNSAPTIMLLDSLNVSEKQYCMSIVIHTVLYRLKFGLIEIAVSFLVF